MLAFLVHLNKYHKSRPNPLGYCYNTYFETIEAPRKESMAYPSYSHSALCIIRQSYSPVSLIVTKHLPYHA